MLESINVRFFVTNYEDSCEVGHSEFVERYASNPHSRVDIELHSVYANGVRQLCINLNED